MLRRRVRVAEYYRIPPHKLNFVREFDLYNEARDNFFSLSFYDLLRMAKIRPSGVDDHQTRLTQKMIEKALSFNGDSGSTPARSGGSSTAAFLGGRIDHGPRSRHFGSGVLSSGTRSRVSSIWLGMNEEDALNQIRRVLSHSRTSNTILPSLIESIKGRAIGALTVTEICNLPMALIRVSQNEGILLTASRSPTRDLVHMPVQNNAFDAYLQRFSPDADQLDSIHLHSHIWPPQKGWERSIKVNNWTLLDGLNVSEQFKRTLYLKRVFYRYGYRINDSAKKHNLYALMPFGAFDEPNNRFHYTFAGADRANRTIAGYLHSAFTWSTDLIDRFMTKKNSEFYYQKLKNSTKFISLLINSLAMNVGSDQNVTLLEASI